MNWTPILETLPSKKEGNIAEISRAYTFQKQPPDEATIVASKHRVL